MILSKIKVNIRLTNFLGINHWKGILNRNLFCITNNGNNQNEEKNLMKNARPINTNLDMISTQE
jgi:hypothetical protein